MSKGIARSRIKNGEIYTLLIQKEVSKLVVYSDLYLFDLTIQTKKIHSVEFVEGFFNQTIDLIMDSDRYTLKQLQGIDGLKLAKVIADRLNVPLKTQFLPPQSE